MHFCTYRVYFACGKRDPHVQAFLQVLCQYPQSPAIMLEKHCVDHSKRNRTTLRTENEASKPSQNILRITAGGLFDSLGWLVSPTTPVPRFTFYPSPPSDVTRGRRIQHPSERETGRVSRLYPFSLGKEARGRERWLVRGGGTRTGQVGAGAERRSNQQNRRRRRCRRHLRRSHLQGPAQPLPETPFKVQQCSYDFECYNS